MAFAEQGEESLFVEARHHEPLDEKLGLIEGRLGAPTPNALRGERGIEIYKPRQRHSLCEGQGGAPMVHLSLRKGDGFLRESDDRYESG